MERSEGEPKISIPPSAIAKCSVRLMSKETPFSHVPSLVILNSATVSSLNPPVVVSLLASKHTKKKKPCSHITRGRAGMSACMSASRVVLGVKHVPSDPPRSPGCYEGGGTYIFIFME